MSDSKYLDLNREDSDKNLCHLEIFAGHPSNFDMLTTPLAEQCTLVSKSMQKYVELNLFLCLVSTLEEPIAATKPYFDQLVESIQVTIKGIGKIIKKGKNKRFN